METTGSDPTQVSTKRTAREVKLEGAIWTAIALLEGLVGSYDVEEGRYFALETLIDAVGGKAPDKTPLA